MDHSREPTGGKLARPKLGSWLKQMEGHAAALRVRGEMEEGLKVWEKSGRFEKIVKETEDTSFQWIYD